MTILDHKAAGEKPAAGGVPGLKTDVEANGTTAAIVRNNRRVAGADKTAVAVPRIDLRTAAVRIAAGRTGAVVNSVTIVGVSKEIIARDHSAAVVDSRATGGTGISHVLPDRNRVEIETTFVNRKRRSRVRAKNVRLRLMQKRRKYLESPRQL